MAPFGGDVGCAHLVENVVDEYREKLSELCHGAVDQFLLEEDFAFFGVLEVEVEKVGTALIGIGAGAAGWVKSRGADEIRGNRFLVPNTASADVPMEYRYGVVWLIEANAFRCGGGGYGANEEVVCYDLGGGY